MNGCPKCGAWVSLGATDCVKCHLAFGGDNQPIQLPEPQPDDGTEALAQPGRSRARVPSAAKILLLLAVAIALFRFLALRPLMLPRGGGSGLVGFYTNAQALNSLVTAQATLDILAGGLAVVGLVMWFRKR